MQMPDFISRGRIPIKTKITAVTVYPERATVVRQGHITITQAHTVLEIGPLPAVLQPDSIRVQFVGGTAVGVLQKPRLQSLDQSAEGKQNKPVITDRLHQAEDAFRNCKDVLLGLNQQKTLLESLSDQTAHSFAQGLSQQSMSLEDIENFLAFFETSYQKNAAAIASKERQKQKLDVQLQKIRRLSQKTQDTAEMSQYCLLLPIEFTRMGDLLLKLSYDVTQVQWQSVYDIRLEDNQPSIQMNCIADIRQNTGESWENVDIRVSTMAPDQWVTEADPRLLQATHQNESPREEPRSRVRIKSRSPVLDETYRMLGAVPGSEIPMDEEVIKSEGAVQQPITPVVSYPAIAPATVPSDNQLHQVLLNKLQLDNETSYLALPQQSDVLYLRAILTNTTSNQSLLPGSVNLFHEGAYVGEDSIDRVAPEDSFQLNFGLDNRICVKRDLVSHEDTQTGAQCRLLRAYRLTLHNPFAYSINVAVIEQLPVSRIRAIRVNLVKSDPAISLNEVGQCRWSMQLAAQKTHYIYYEYTVEHPSSLEIPNIDG